MTAARTEKDPPAEHSTDPAGQPAAARSDNGTTHAEQQPTRLRIVPLLTVSAAALASTMAGLYEVAGPRGAILGAGALGVAGAATATRAARRRRRRRRRAGARTPTAAVFRPRRTRTGAAMKSSGLPIRTGRRTANTSTASPGRRWSGVRRPSTGKQTSSGNPLRTGKRTRAGSGTGRARRRVRTGATSIGRAVRRRATRTGLGRSVNAVRRGVRGTRNPFRAASRAARSSVRSRRRRWLPIRVVTAGLAGLTAAAWVTTIGAIRVAAHVIRWLYRRVTRRTEITTGQPVAATVRRPNPPTRPPAPAARPADPPTRTTQGVTMSDAAISPHMRALLGIAEELQILAARYDVDDMLTYGADLHARPELIDTIRRAFDSLAQKGRTEYPIHPSVAETEDLIVATLGHVHAAAEQVGPAFESLHREELDRLRNPRVAEYKWDVTAGGGAR